MVTRTEADRIIRQVYYNSENGFGSISDTFKQSKKTLNAITYERVKDFLERRKSRQTKGYRGFNSYVAREPLQEIQLDIGIFTESSKENEGWKYLLVAVDIFT